MSSEERDEGRRCQGCEDAPLGQHTGPHDWERDEGPDMEWLAGLAALVESGATGGVSAMQGAWQDGYKKGAANHITTQDEKIKTLTEALKRIRQWDMLDVASDGPFWKQYLDQALESHPKGEAWRALKGEDVKGLRVSPRLEMTGEDRPRIEIRGCILEPSRVALLEMSKDWARVDRSQGAD